MRLNIAGIIVELVNPSLPVHTWFATELGLYLSDETQEPTIRFVFAPIDLPKSGRYVSSHVFISDNTTYLLQKRSAVARISFNTLLTDATTELLLSPTIAAQTVVTLVESLVHLALIRLGRTFVHSSAVTYHGKGIVFSAWAHTGKSNIVLGLLGRGAGYLADDWSIIAPDTIYAYPKSLNLFDYNFKHYPELKKTVPLGLRTVFGVNRAVVTIGRSVPQLLKTLHHYSGKAADVLDAMGHIKVPILKAFPTASLPATAPLTRLFLVIRSRVPQVTLSQISPADYAHSMTLCAYHERKIFFTWYTMSQFAEPSIHNPLLDAFNDTQYAAYEKIASTITPELLQLPDDTAMADSIASIAQFIELKK